MENKTKVLLNFFGLCLFVGVIGFLVSESVGLSLGGFDTAEILQQQSFYLIGGIFLLLIICGFAIEYIIKKGDDRYGSSVLFSSLGEKPSVPYFKKFSQFRMLFLSVIVASILGLFAFVTKQTSFTGLPKLTQQFTPQANLLYGSLLIPASENLGLALVILITIVIIRVLARKNNWTSANFAIMTYIFCPLMGAIYWVINHLLHYSGQEISLLAVLGFGFVMSLITVLTGSFIPAWILHISNNLFYDMQSIFTRDSVIIFVGIIIAVLVFIYLLIFRKGSKLNKANQMGSSNVS
jgi:hypothetical protein